MNLFPTFSTKQCQIAYIFFWLSLFFFSPYSYAQKQGNNWFFGNHAGVNFNSGSAVAVTGGATDGTNNMEGTATISDTAGKLLFYTDGQTVWNRNHVTMGNGTGLMGNASATQSAVIVPHPTSLDTFFIFTVDDCQHNLANGLRYSIVRMSLNGGLGGVTSMKNILLSPSGVPVAEKITAVKHCNNEDIWVIGHGYGSTYGKNFYAWLITPSGINTTPVISSVGTVHRGSRSAPYNGVGNARGYMKASTNGSRIALAITFDGAPDNQDPNTSTNGSFEIFDFNYTTGAVTNPIKFGPSSNYKGAYGVEFSPGGTYLYGSTWGNYGSPRSIYQWNLKAGTVTAIQNSATLIATANPNPGAMQLASNGKIYIVKDQNPNGYLDCINNPNNGGSTCTYQNNALFLLNTRYGRLGLPTFIQSFFDPGFSHSGNFEGKPTSFVISDTLRLDSVYWNFGDPASGVLNHSKKFNPFHIYSDTGKFNIVLVLFKCNRADTLKSSIYIYALPKIHFSLNDSTQCLKGNNVIFTNTTTINGGTITSYLWRFGDGNTSSSVNTSHIFTTSGTYTVWLVATSNLGGKDSLSHKVFIHPMPTASFTINDSLQCQGGNNFIFNNNSVISSGTISYRWYFGNGDTATQKDPIHTYLNPDTLNVKLVDISDKGCPDSMTKTVYILPSPKAVFSVNDSDQCLSGNNFLFSNTSSIAWGIYADKWDFGDLSSSVLRNPAHAYTTFGMYSVKLLLTSTLGCKDSLIKKMYVFSMPKAGFTINDSIQCAVSSRFVFKNISTIPNGTISYLWTLGDGNTSASADSVVHFYGSANTYLIKLLTTSNKGCKDSISKQVWVDAIPTASFSVDKTVECFKWNLFNFTNLSTIPSGSISFLWKFDDNTTSTQINPAHHFPYDDTFMVKLIASSNKGCLDSVTRNIYVRPTPVPNFSINDSIQCLFGNNVIFRNHSTIHSGTIFYDWDLGDGIHSSRADSVVHQYSNYNNFAVKLMVNSSLGCKDTLAKTMYILPMPLPDFSINNNAQCQVNNLFIFSNSSTIPYGSLTYLWNFGDGNTSTATNLPHSYNLYGNYTIALIATSQEGCIDSVKRSLVVFPMPDARFVNSIGCLEDTTFFTNTSVIISPDNIISWAWDFGDGNLSINENPFNIYALPGLYAARLTVVSNNNCSDFVINMVRVNEHVIANVITRATVDNDTNIIIDWESVGIGMPRDYVLERSTDNVVFSRIGKFNLSTLTYTDKTTNVDQTSYIYRMKIIDSCDYIGPYSNIGKSILLTAETNTLHPVLHWTPYREWTSGVKEYQVEIWQEKVDAFVPAGAVAGDTTYIDNFTHLNQAEYCYRVIAIRDDGIQSISNTRCVATPFALWVPDAFSPNGDGDNDVFKILGKYIFGYHIVIFNRWGEKMYQSDNIDDSWDGNYQGSPCPNGYYYYRINATGTKGQGSNIDGMMLLMR